MRPDLPVLATAPVDGLGPAARAEIVQLCSAALEVDCGPRMAFFARLGWEAWQGPVPGVLHDPADTLMILRTATSPRLDAGATMFAQP